MAARQRDLQAEWSGGRQTFAALSEEPEDHGATPPGSDAERADPVAGFVSIHRVRSLGPTAVSLRVSGGGPRGLGLSIPQVYEAEVR